MGKYPLGYWLFPLIDNMQLLKVDLLSNNAVVHSLIEEIRQLKSKLWSFLEEDKFTHFKVVDINPLFQ